MSKTAIYGIVDGYAQADAIADHLHDANFSPDDVSVLFADKEGTRDFAHEKHTKAPEGATAGGVTGGVAGGVAGWLVGIGALAIPGVGPLIAAGPILAALSGAAVGAAAGGIAGGLIGLGIPEYEARQYEEKIKAGGVLIAVHSENADETKRAKKILEEGGAKDIATRSDEGVSKKDRAAA
jgi:hypothetical protein